MLPALSSVVTPLVRQAVRPRFVKLALLLLQFLVVGVVPVFDARVEGAAYGAVAHVEDIGRTDCPLGHEPGECQLCRVLRSASLPVPAASLASIEPVAAPAMWWGAERAPLDGAGFSARPRAPPA